MKNKIQVEKGHYSPDHYLGLRRWITYWYQIDLAIKLCNDKNDKIMEIGIGNKTISSILKLYGYSVTACDIDIELKPTIIGTITNLPFKRETFRTVICCEVLEHIHFDQFEVALKELYRCSSKYVILSLPYASIFGIAFAMSFNIDFGKRRFKLPQKNLSFKLPSLRKFGFNGEHYWEIGAKGCSLTNTKKIITNSGFKIIKELKPMLNFRHIFFVLEKA